MDCKTCRAKRRYVTKRAVRFLCWRRDGDDVNPHKVRLCTRLCAAWLIRINNRTIFIRRLESRELLTLKKLRRYFAEFHGYKFISQIGFTNHFVNERLREKQSQSTSVIFPIVNIFILMIAIITIFIKDNWRGNYYTYIKRERCLSLRFI